MATEALVLVGSAASNSTPVMSNALATADARTRLDFGGVLVDQVDLRAAMERIESFVHSRRPHQVVTVNLDFVSIAGRDDEFRAVLNLADLAVADGMPLVWLSRLKGTRLAQRVPGVDLFAACCALAADQDLGVFLLGAAPGVAQRAAATLQDTYPHLRIVGCYAPPTGPITADEDARMVRMIRAAAPEFLFVALGAPRQDIWISQHLEHLNVPVSMGVGCVFDVFAGAKKRAPTWMQHSGLEWAFRLVQEPARLWRRYLVDDVPALGRLLLTIRTERPERQLVVPT